MSRFDMSDLEWGFIERWSWNLDHVAGVLRWIRFSHQAAIFSMVGVVSYASFGVNTP